MLFFISFTHFFGDHPFQQKAKIPPVDPTVFGAPIRQAEGALFQTLIPDGQSIAVPIEQFDPVAVSVTKDKQGTGKRILSQSLTGSSRTGHRRTFSCRMRTGTDRSGWRRSGQA